MKKRRKKNLRRGTSFVHGVVCKVVIIMVKGINYK